MRVEIAVPLIVVALALVLHLVERWCLRQRARAALEALAATLGIKRKKTETDEELRARCRSIVFSVPTFTRDSMRVMVEDALWDHGYRRAVVVLSEPDFGRVLARVCEKVPATVLRDIEGELRDRVPLTMHIELSADT